MRSCRVYNSCGNRCSANAVFVSCDYHFVRPLNECATVARSVCCTCNFSQCVWILRIQADVWQCACAIVKQIDNRHVQRWLCVEHTQQRGLALLLGHSALLAVELVSVRIETNESNFANLYTCFMISAKILRCACSSHSTMSVPHVRQTLKSMRAQCRPGSSSPKRTVTSLP